MPKETPASSNEEAPRGDTCEKCRHWKRRAAKEVPVNRNGIVEGMKIAEVGECRHGPPPHDYRWPKTCATDGCGAFEAAVSKPRKPRKTRKAGGAE